MREVIVLCEGKTEQEFCNLIVQPWLAANGVLLFGTLLGRTQKKQGGIRSWPVYREELLRLGKERADRVVSLLVDYYGMPQTWPGRSAATQKAAIHRGATVEQSLADDLGDELGERFVPCVMLHEFESLLFVDPYATSESLAAIETGVRPDTLATQLTDIRRKSGNQVEAINDSPMTSPSKQIQGLVAGYDKVGWGVSILLSIGLDRLRIDCPWLNRWLTRLVELGEA